MPTTAPTRTVPSTDHAPTRRIAPRREEESGRPTLPPGYESTSTRRMESDPSGERTQVQNGTTFGRRPSLPVRLWRIVKSIYYASSPAWQFLKSGALLLLGLFFWSASNLLLSYEPTWHWPYFFMAYGFLLTPYGPFTHLVLVPHVIPWLRRRPRTGWLHQLGRHLTLTSLTLFFSAVLWLGLLPPSIMQIDFRAATTAETVDVAPRLSCARSDTGSTRAIRCHLERTAGVEAIAVESGGTRLLRRTEPPFSFSVRPDQLVEVVRQRQFQVVVFNAENEPVRRFNKTLASIR